MVLKDMDRMMYGMFAIVLVLSVIMVISLFFIFEEEKRLQVEIKIHNNTNETVNVKLYLKNRFITNFSIEGKHKETRYWVEGSNNLTYGKNSILIKWEINGREYEDKKVVNLTKKEPMAVVDLYIEKN